MCSKVLHPDLELRQRLAEHIFCWAGWVPQRKRRVAPKRHGVEVYGLFTSQSVQWIRNPNSIPIRLVC